MELVLATHNVHKIREFRNILKHLKHIDLVSLLNFPNYVPPPEDCSTFQENALKKAEHAAQALNKTVLADDSGLVVPNIKDSPGVHSKRYAGEDATDAENRQKLLKALEGLNDLERAAYFECSLALVSPTGIKKCVTGRCEGIITQEEKGSNGFGYDSIFIEHDYRKTFGELDEATKNRISHRRKAVEKLLPILETLNT